MRKSQVLYFANFTMFEFQGRSTDSKVFMKLGEAKEFMADKYGFIIRQDGNEKNSLHSFCNGFSPSAYQERVIEGMIDD